MTRPDIEMSGPRCPILESYDPVSDDQLVDPFSAWALARRETPVFFSPVLQAYVVTRYDDICTILNDAATFSSRDMLRPLNPNPAEVDDILTRGFDPGKLGAIVMLDPPEHTKIRRSVAEAFTPRRVAMLQEEVRADAGELIDKMRAAGSNADFVEAFAYPLPLRIICRLLGVPLEDTAQLHQWAGFKMALQFGDMPLEEHVQAALGYVEFQGYVHELINERRAHPRDDLISSMTEPKADGIVLDDAVLVGQVMGLVNAGHETTTTVLTMGLFHLLSNPTQWKMLCDRPELAAAAAEEALRFDGPIKQLWRRVTRDVEVGGVHIPSGSRIAIANGSANRDENVFEAAEHFDIAAPRDKQQLAFGRGIHFCAGASLARAEVRTAFEQLSTRLPSLRLTDGAVAFARNVTVRMPLGLSVEWDG